MRLSTLRPTIRDTSSPRGVKSFTFDCPKHLGVKYCRLWVEIWPHQKEDGPAGRIWHCPNIHDVEHLTVDPSIDFSARGCSHVTITNGEVQVG